MGAVLNAIAMNFFLIPANVFASGFTGTAQIISAAFSIFTNIEISTGVLVLLLNIPIAILAWFKVGKSFTFYSFMAVVLMSFFLEVIPVQSFSDDILLNAVFGGVIGLEEGYKMATAVSSVQLVWGLPCVSVRQQAVWISSP